MNIKYLIVDGSNATRKFYGYERGLRARDLVALDNQHSKSMLSFLAAVHRRLGIPEIKVYFDGTVRPQDICPRNLPLSVRVEFGAGTAADELMVREARGMINLTGGIVLITDDRELCERIRGLGKLKIRPVDTLKALAHDAGLDTDLYFHSV